MAAFLTKRIYDASGNPEQIIKNGLRHEYTYDALSQISSEPYNLYHHDALYNRTKKNDTTAEINLLNELESLGSSYYSYDDRGNMTTKGDLTFSYDALNRLKQVTSSDSTITLLYDPLGRRLSKNSSIETERYLYDGEEEIGAVTSSGCPKNLKVGTAAIELENRPFAPIFDTHNNICALINPITKKLAAEYTFTAFGEEQRTRESLFNPWRYASKRLDPEINLIYFGKRYYDPELARWLTTDPAGFIDSTNLYQYVYNNPFRYADPNGEFVFAIPLLIWGTGLIFPSLTTIITTAVYTAAAATATYVGYKAVEFANNYDARSFSYDSSWPPTIEMWKNTDVYTPDRPLPTTEDGVPIPDTDVPHTQLGVGSGRKGKYPQAREFDKDGQPNREIDFTDHGRPKEHKNPHQHRREKNPTGGTPTREDAEPLPEWRY